LLAELVPFYPGDLGIAAHQDQEFFGVRQHAAINSAKMPKVKWKITDTSKIV
jgi:hypothetical protein